MEYSIKISIVVPIYNVQGYLERCIESIVTQSYINIEIILVDDGSTDNSSKICDFYARLDKRIQVIHKKNGGVTSARKKGAELASGDYILSVDGDDWIEKDRVEELVVKGIFPARADMIYLAGYKKDFENYSQTLYCDITERMYFRDEIEKELLYLYCGVGENIFTSTIIFSMSTWAVKRDLFKKKQQYVDDRIIMGEDEIFIWYCLLSAENVSMIIQNGYHYVQRASSSMHVSEGYGSQYIESIKYMYIQLKQYIEDYSLYPQETKRIFINVIMKNVFSLHYELVLRKHADYLYPFPKVRKGSRIVVYGAGRMGYALMKYLIKSEDYQVVLWVDQNLGLPALSEYKISPVTNILQSDFDFIVIAVMYASTSKEIAEQLINIGISEGKIARIDANVIEESALPNDILGIKNRI